MTACGTCRTRVEVLATGHNVESASAELRCALIERTNSSTDLLDVGPPAHAATVLDRISGCTMGDCHGPLRGTDCPAQLVGHGPRDRALLLSVVGQSQARRALRRLHRQRHDRQESRREPRRDRARDPPHRLGLDAGQGAALLRPRRHRVRLLRRHARHGARPGHDRLAQPDLRRHARWRRPGAGAAGPTIHDGLLSQGDHARRAGRQLDQRAQPAHQRADRRFPVAVLL